MGQAGRPLRPATWPLSPQSTFRRFLPAVSPPPRPLFPAFSVQTSTGDFDTISLRQEWRQNSPLTRLVDVSIGAGSPAARARPGANRWSNVHIGPPDHGPRRSHLGLTSRIPASRPLYSPEIGVSVHPRGGRASGRGGREPEPDRPAPRPEGGERPAGRSAGRFRRGGQYPASYAGSRFAKPEIGRLRPSLFSGHVSLPPEFRGLTPTFGLHPGGVLNGPR